jgi:DNA-binding response OmpR family regulator
MKILLVEDDTFFREFYAAKLKEDGMEVEVASDGEEGLDKATKLKPDLILLDIIMPKKDGFEVLQALSQSATMKKVPVIVFSTLGQESDVEKAKKLGARDYINKSFFDFENLKTKIKALSQK